MYGIDIFNNIKISLDWYVVYHGIKENLLDLQVAREFVLRKMERNEEVSDEELELSWESKSQLDVLETIEKISNLQLDDAEKMKIAKNKIRIAIVVNLRNCEVNSSRLFQKMDMVYADFDYPEDMESFISYMPVKDNYIAAEHTQEENEHRLLNNLDLFIHEQLKQY